MSNYTHAARKIGMTAAEQFWYVLGCVAFGAAYLRKVPVKKALADYGLVEMTAAEKFWYVLGCVCFGAAYLSKVPVAKALSELDQFQVAGAAPHDELQPHEVRLSGPEPLETQPSVPPETRGSGSGAPVRGAARTAGLSLSAVGVNAAAPCDNGAVILHGGGGLQPSSRADFVPRQAW